MDFAKIKFYLELSTICLVVGSIASILMTMLMSSDVSMGRLMTSIAMTMISAYCMIKYNETFDTLAKKWGWRK